jgi:hypothetical protein
LDLEIKADAKLRRLDDFLRRTWVECCGHLSEFSVAGYDYLVSLDRSWEVAPNERTMNARGEGVGSRQPLCVPIVSSTASRASVRRMRESMRTSVRRKPPSWRSSIRDGWEFADIRVRSELHYISVEDIGYGQVDRADAFARD